MMQCPKCHIEVEKGNLYCPNCLTEIPWVKEFDSVETQMERRKLETPEHREAPESIEITTYRKRRTRLKQTGFLLCVIAAVFLCLLFYRYSRTFEALYSQSVNAYKQQDYEKALMYLNDALEQRPENLSANLLLAKTMGKQGDTDGAIKVLKPMVQRYTESERAYRMLVLFLEREGKTAEIKKLLKNCHSQKVLAACQDYICEEPVSSLPPGTYTSRQQVKLTADYTNIYYTLDGSMPTEKSKKYVGAIVLEEGATVLKAIGINAKGISSDVIIRKYLIVLNAPENVEITPEEGDYSKDTKITVKVPEGCRAYYAFDKMPSVQSTEYQRPIAMPQGYHVFYVILVAANGKISKTASREYYLQY